MSLVKQRPVLSLQFIVGSPHCCFSWVENKEFCCAKLKCTCVYVLQLKQRVLLARKILEASALIAHPMSTTRQQVAPASPVQLPVKLQMDSLVKQLVVSAIQKRNRSVFLFVDIVRCHCHFIKISFPLYFVVDKLRRRAWGTVCLKLSSEKKQTRRKFLPLKRVGAQCWWVQWVLLPLPSGCFDANSNN